MIDRLLQLWTGDRGLVLGHPRSPAWPALERAIIRDHPLCSACGGTELLQVHHVLAYHVRPDLEMDPANLIVLCMDKDRCCHFVFGHMHNWRTNNPEVREMAKKFHDLKKSLRAA